MNSRKLLVFLTPLICVAISSLFLFTSSDAKLADLNQTILPPTSIREDVVMVGIDDYAIELIGTFPFTRDIYAGCISVMEEMGADSVVFDLSFIDDAKAAVNSDFEPFYPDDVMEAALEKSKITYLNFTFDYYSHIEDYEREIFQEKCAVKNLTAKNDRITKEYTGVQITIPNFLKNAVGAGCVNADPDRDNYYRRVNALVKYDGEYYSHLTFPAVLKKLGNPDVIVENRKITLQNAQTSSGAKNIVIPRGNDGKVILKYPPIQFDDYNYLSIGDIYRVVQLKMYMEEDGEEEYVDEYMNLCTELRKKLPSALCIIGTCATSTSDYGVNQYEAQYPLPGVHYTFANQVLNGDFVGEAPAIVSIIYALFFALLLVYVSFIVKSTSGKIIHGFIVVLLSETLLVVFYRITRIYVGQTVPLISTFLTYVSSIIIGFFMAAKDKKFITNAFSQCLSKEIVNQIVVHPDSFKLGGESIEMSAIFTDIRKFSSFSELLSAAQLVALLNYYLTKMSDIIMAEGGTIDKYEGDAIVALVGAPLKMADHARRAVRAALNMKASEKLMNEEIRSVASKAKPETMSEDLYSAFKLMVINGKEIFTRIGINSGEMIAGYMGSENKKNYTMMGNNVNLASRLEGVNKQYGTFGILVSEETFRQLGDEFICRRLDKVQVVNVNTPLNLYEPLSLASKADAFLVQYASDWEKAMTAFDQADYEGAVQKFKSLSEQNPSDKVALYYVNLLEEFFLRGTYPKKDDDFGVAYNTELKCFKLLNK